MADVVKRTKKERKQTDEVSERKREHGSQVKLGPYPMSDSASAAVSYSESSTSPERIKCNASVKKKKK